MVFSPTRKQKFFGIKQFLSLIFVFAVVVNSASAGISIVKSNGISVTGVDGVNIIDPNGVSVSGVDGLLAYKSNGISVTGTDGVTVSGVDGVSVAGADGVTYTGGSGVTVSGADGVTVSGADGITVSGTDGITVTGADGQIYTVDSIKVSTPNGVTISGADGITVSGADGVTVTGTDGVTISGADGVTISGTDGISVSGADDITGYDTNGVVFSLSFPTGVTVSGTDGVSISGADGITISGADGISVSGVDAGQNGNQPDGLQSVDPELALLLSELTNDSNVNATLVYHQMPTESDFDDLRNIGILGGTKFKNLPFVIVTGTRDQIISVSQLQNVRSIYGTRTLEINSDPYFERTGIQRVLPDVDLQTNNSGFPVTGKDITVAVLDTGVNGTHSDLAGKVVQNVKLLDTQSLPVGFTDPIPVENLPTTDLVNGHGTFVAGIISASGSMSGGKYNGVASGAKILGLGAGDLALINILSGFDYVLEKRQTYNIRVINCSFSANTVYDPNDPVNIATKLLTENGVNVVFSAGNTGSGNQTLNPYAKAPWVISVGATDQNAKLADFSSRGKFGSQGPTLVAPGVDVVSVRSLVSQMSLLGVGGGDLSRLSLLELPFYTVASGTSFSAPQVAGAIALMLEADPSLTPAQVKDILSRTSTPIPGRYSHEVGAGMLNTHAAVLESAFPERRMGYFRSVMERGAVKYTTEVSDLFNGTVSQGSTVENTFTIPDNTIQAGFHISWGSGLNDLSLKLRDSNNSLIGESNYVNLLGLTGRREKVILDNPTSQTLKTQVGHTLNLGTSQEFFGAVELTYVDLSSISDINGLSANDQKIVKDSLSSFLMLPEGEEFRPDFAVTRLELAESFVRGGFVPQYVAGNPVFPDVQELSRRNAVESVFKNPDGSLIYNASNGNNFDPSGNVDKLTAAVALVKAGNLEGQLPTAILPLTVFDRFSIPASLRPYVAVALNNDLIELDGNKFKPSRTLKRIELAKGLVKLKELSE